MAKLLADMDECNMISLVIDLYSKYEKKWMGPPSDCNRARFDQNKPECLLAPEWIHEAEKKDYLTEKLSRLIGKHRNSSLVKFA